jgi:hypothetical protein
MEDPKTIRLNDADLLDRRARFERAVKKTAGNGNEIIRRLVDAWLYYVAVHGHGPPFPVELVPIEEKKKPKSGKRPPA